MQQHVSTDKNNNLFHRILVSIFPGRQHQPRGTLDYRRFFNSLILHFRPRSVPKQALGFTLSWGLGGMSAVLITLLFVTGLLMKFIYQPLPDRAYDSILFLQEGVMFGQLVRNIHYWSANILLIIAFLHLLRVFFTGALHAPRQFNWIIGLGLFLILLLSNFTGYLLPWDQLSFWAITISTGMLEYIPEAGPWLQQLILGGSEVGIATLSNFYAIHTAVLPVILILLMSFHFWRVRKAGGLVMPQTTENGTDPAKEKVPSIPDLLVRELVVALVLIASVLMISVFFNAPLGDTANPGLSPNPTKAPWYFMGFQEILFHLHPFIAVCLVPAVMGIGLLSIPYLRYPVTTEGIWFASRSGRSSSAGAAFAALIITPLAVLMDEYGGFIFGWIQNSLLSIAKDAVLLILLLTVLSWTYGVVKRKYSLNKNESMQMIFVFFMTAFIILTVIGIWFRGPEMRLVWPWEF